MRGWCGDKLRVIERIAWTDFFFVPNSWVSGLTQQAIAQLTGDPRYLRFNVLIREDAKGSPFTDVNAKAALSPQLFEE